MTKSCGTIPTHCGTILPHATSNGNCEPQTWTRVATNAASKTSTSSRRCQDPSPCREETLYVAGAQTHRRNFLSQPKASEEKSWKALSSPAGARIHRSNWFKYGASHEETKRMNKQNNCDSYHKEAATEKSTYQAVPSSRYKEEVAHSQAQFDLKRTNCAAATAHLDLMKRLPDMPNKPPSSSLQDAGEGYGAYCFKRYKEKYKHEQNWRFKDNSTDSVFFEKPKLVNAELGQGDGSARPRPKFQYTSTIPFKNFKNVIKSEPSKGTSNGTSNGNHKRSNEYDNESRRKAISLRGASRVHSLSDWEHKEPLVSPKTKVNGNTNVPIHAAILEEVTRIGKTVNNRVKTPALPKRKTAINNRPLGVASSSVILSGNSFRQYKGGFKFLKNNVLGGNGKQTLITQGQREQERKQNHEDAKKTNSTLSRKQSPTKVSIGAWEKAKNGAADLLRTNNKFKLLAFTAGNFSKASPGFLNTEDAQNRLQVTNESKFKTMARKNMNAASWFKDTENKIREQ